MAWVKKEGARGGVGRGTTGSRGRGSTNTQDFPTLGAVGRGGDRNPSLSAGSRGGRGTVTVGRGRASLIESGDKPKPPDVITPPKEVPKPPVTPAWRTLQQPIQNRPEKPIVIPDEQEELIQELKTKLAPESHLPKLELVRRPGKGTCGRKFPIYANHFVLKIPSGYVYHYDVEIDVVRKEAIGEKMAFDNKKLRPLSLKLNRMIIETMRKTDEIFQNCFPAYDGNKNLITKNPLPIEKDIERIVDYEEEELRKDRTKKISQFKVIIKPVRKKESKTCAINLDTLHQVYEKKVGTVAPEAVMAIETILRHCPAFNLVPVGRSMYMRPERKDMREISGGLNIWFGYHQSVHVGENSLLLNIDRATTVFYPAIPLIELVFKILSDIGNRNASEGHTLQPFEISYLSKELKNLKIYVKHLPYQKKFTIYNVSREGARDIEFQTNERKFTVAQYFQVTHNIRLRYPMFPCVNVGNATRPIFQPIEVCFIKDDQPYRRKLNPRQTSDIIRSTAIPPKQRFEDIYRKLRQMDQICDPVKNEFGISIEKKPINFQARQLMPPFLVYNGNKRIKPNNGSWDLKNTGFFHTCTIEKWALVSLAFPRFCGPRELENFSRKLQEEARNLCIKMSSPVDICTPGRNERIEELLVKLKDKHGDGLMLIVVVLKDDAQYAPVKKTCDTVLGVATQCIKDCNVVKKCNPQLLCNLLQKINCKVGGINMSLSPDDRPDIFKRPVIIIGADVTHPAPGDKIRPSIAAVVGSIDSNPSRYAVSIRVQAKSDRMQRRLEIIQDLKAMIKELLKAFFKSTKFKPETIIFFRDGVSEGQFEEVRDNEIAMIKAACDEMSTHQPYKPRLTFIVIQKRHHTRFMPANDADGVGKCGNVPPGTTVDSHVTDPHIFDYFQCSHFGIQGTSRPTKYTVLYDDANFSSDEVQKLTFHLCHTYARCTRSISVPCPVMYAHLAAYRAKEHLTAARMQCSGSDLTSSTSEEDMEMGEISGEFLDAIKVPVSFKNTMYFV